MRPLLVLVLAASACNFSGPDQPVDAQVDAPPDTPPLIPGVSFTSVAVNQATIRPGLYGIEVMTVLRNGHTSPITNIRASLTFLEGTTDRAADFRWRDADARDGVPGAQPVTIAPGGEATFVFRLDALASAAPPGTILVNGSARFETDGRTYAATPLDPPASLAFDELLPPPIVVNITTDESNGNGNNNISFREALEKALANPGFDRIVFDQTVFPPGIAKDIVLDESFDQLPPLTTDVTVIDGGSSNVTIEVDSTWAAPTGRSGLRIAGGTLVVHGLGFRNFAFGYLQEDVSVDNCGSGIQRQGGAILVTDGTLILDGNTFSDPGVTERNCYATSVLIAGGSGHRILNNYWTKQVMDSLNIRAPTIEVSDNVMDAGTAAADLDKTDDCILVETEDDSNLWIVGNVCLDQEFSAVVAHGGGTGIIHIVNNTFARNGRIPGMSAVRREAGQRRIELHNNAYHANLPGAIQTDDMNGVNMTISHESAFPLQFCSGCSNAIIDPSVVNGPTAIGLTNPDGATRGDLTPQAGGPLVDKGTDLVDRNGSAPGRFNGDGVDRGAFELP